MEAFIIMPNHVHIVIRLREAQKLGKVLHSWRSFAAKEINRRIGAKGKLWQDDYSDRIVRNEKHLRKCIEYIIDNPKKAKIRKDEYTLYLMSF